MPTNDTLTRLIGDLTCFISVLDRGDADALADHIIETIIKTLRADARLPKLSLRQWDLLLADLRNDVADHVADFIDGMADFNDTVDVIRSTIEESDDIIIARPTGDQQ
jgi:hypothetical protein